MGEERSPGFGTRAVHSGGGHETPAGEFRPSVFPIYAASAFYYPTQADLDAVFSGEKPGFVYTRNANPTVAALERAVADLEGGAAAVAFGSGMAAVHGALLALELAPGDRLLVARDLYGATRDLLLSFFEPMGVGIKFADLTDLEKARALLAADRPKGLFFEVVTNPVLRVLDVPALAALGRRYGAKVVVDATFATPYLYRPLAAGADLVVHSATKYLAGHGDVMGGLVVTGPDLEPGLRTIVRLVGSVLGPFEAWLILRGIRTLHLRLERHCANAARVADWLAAHPKIGRVYYPGRSDHPDHAVARRLFGDRFGGMVAFELKDATRDRTMRFIDGLRLCRPAPTLGDVFTEVLYPPISSHRYLGPEERRKLGITDGLVRMSVGIEDPEDIIADLDQALAKA
jgi:cystathionine gamma-synthase/methionine-gamma-lyase